MSNLTYVFVHGLAGWGRYDEKYARRPYWGMGGGDLMVHLREQGYACYAASVSPMGSAASDLPAASWMSIVAGEASFLPFAT